MLGVICTGAVFWREESKHYPHTQPQRIKSPPSSSSCWVVVFLSFPSSSPACSFRTRKSARKPHTYTRTLSCFLFCFLFVFLSFTHTHTLSLCLRDHAGSIALGEKWIPFFLQRRREHAAPPPTLAQAHQRQDEQGRALKTPRGQLACLFFVKQQLKGRPTHTQTHTDTHRHTHRLTHCFSFFLSFLLVGLCWS